MEIDEMRKYVTPKSYTLVMLILSLFLIIFAFYTNRNFNFWSSGFVLGLWLGFLMRWVFVK